MDRLSANRENLVARLDEVDNNTQSYFSKEEHRLMEDLSTARVKVAEGTEKLVIRLRELDNAREARHHPSKDQESVESSFIPWAAGGLDRLLLKFDYANVDRLVPSSFELG